MDCIRYGLDRIVDITEKELIYRDDRWDLAGIDLQMCRDRYLKYINSHLEEYPERKGIPFDKEQFRCVADRKFNGIEQPYFEFYDWPHMRFEIQIKQNIFHKFQGLIRWNWQKKYYDQFFDIQKRLINAGWQSFDLD